jgi:hypothetical protein
VEDILDHRVSPGPKCDCLVRWKDFDASHDSWVSRKSLTPPALQAYEQFLTEHVQFCEERVKNSKINMHDQQLISARKQLLSFTGNGRYSVRKTSSSSRAPTTSPIAVTSKTSDVAPNAPTAGEVVAPISTSSGRVLRRPTHYKDTRRWSLVFLFLLVLSDVICVSIFSVDPYLLSCILDPSLLCFFFLCLSLFSYYSCRGDYESGGE